MFSLYFTPFITGFLLSLALTWLLIKLSKKLNISFKRQPTHIHNGAVSRLGGIAIILSFDLAIILNGNLVLTNPLIGFLGGAALILFIGTVDDFLNISPLKQLLFQILVSLSVILSGVRVDYINNPFGGAFRLDGFEVFGYPLLGSIFIILWVFFLMNVLNWTDGLDGLAGGAGAVGAVCLFFLSISAMVNQPPLGIISIAFLGSILGFLIFNFHPAKIFMGTTGSMFIGFALAVISIFSGAKLATLVLILSVPILDALWVIAQRVKNKKSIFKGDRSHLHHRLLSAGFSKRQIIVFYYIVTVIFGLTALSTGGLGKIVAFVLFSAVMAGILVSISLLPERRFEDEGIEDK